MTELTRKKDTMEVSPWQRFRTEMDRLIERFAAPWDGFENLWGPGKWSPELDLAETDGEVTMKLEVPGVDPEDLHVDLTDSMLTISGEKKETEERKEESYHRTERRFGSFKRSVRLPAEVDEDSVDASYENGVLTVRMKKTESSMPKRIAVTAK